jgi:hypothetical protein
VTEGRKDIDEIITGAVFHNGKAFLKRRGEVKKKKKVERQQKSFADIDLHFLN